MRLLLLCAAVFAGGLIAGAVFWAEGPGPRGRTPDGGVPTLEPGRGSGDLDGPEGTRPAPRRQVPTPGLGLPGDGIRVRDLAGEAAAGLQETLAGDVAARFLDGDGVIRGTVRDGDGRPVAGVVVTASPEAQPFRLAISAREARERPHEDRDLADVAREAMQAELWRRHVRRTATSGADGRYEMKGLVKSRLRLAAWHERYDVKPAASRQETVEPDATVDFVAHPVQAVRVEVRLPDGELADYAWITWTGPQGQGWDSWMPETGTVRLGAGSCKVRAQAWVPGPLQSPEVEHTAGASDEVLVLTLEGRRVLTAYLELPDGLAMPENVAFGVRKLEGSARVEPDSLRLDQMQRGRESTAGRAAWYDLEPGRYAVAAFLDQRWLLGHAVAEMGEGAVEAAVPVEPPGADAIRVLLLDPDGGAVGGRASFQVIATSGERPQWHPTMVLKGTDGTWYVRAPDLDTGGEAVVRATAQGYGTAEESFRAASPGRVTIRFKSPATLRLQVARYSGSAIEGRLHATLWTERGAASARQVPADGVIDFGSVQPGEFTLFLYGQEGNERWAIVRQEMRLAGGDHERSVALPELHALRIRLPERFGGNVVLTTRDPVLGYARRETRARDGIAAFDALAPGTYDVQIGGKRMEVRVPGPPEVTFE